MCRRLPTRFANAFQFHLFLIELVLNLADEFFDHIFERRDADRAAYSSTTTAKCNFRSRNNWSNFSSRRFRERKSFARHRQQIRRCPRLVAQRIKVFDVNDAARLVQITAFAKRKARVARLFRNGETLGNRRLGVESGDSWRGRMTSRTHDGASRAR